MTAPPKVHMVEVKNASKTFGNVVAVSDVTFSLDAGVTALLGPNGAGKSTLFRMLCGLTPPSSGDVRVLGKDTRTDTSVRGKIGLAPQQDALFDQLTARQFVEMSAKTHGVAQPSSATSRVLELVDLSSEDSKKVGSFSKGMRQRVKLSAALVNDPDVLILDEPLSGLDPLQRGRMIDLFHKLGEEGKCVLVSSHILDEVAKIGSQVLVITQGRLAASGDYRDLRNLMEHLPHVIQLTVDEPRALAAALIKQELVESVRVQGGTLQVQTNDIDTFERQIAPLSRELDVTLRQVVPLDDDLESVFRYLIEGS